MASLRIRVDQENRILETNNQKQMNSTVNTKRPVLGCIDNLPERLTKNKQPLGVVNSKLGDENPHTKIDLKTLPLPVVPVAQFEAFKVYEDDDTVLQNEVSRRRKVKENDPSNFYKGTSEDRFITKKELAELEKLKKQDRIIPPTKIKPESLLQATIEIETPMSIEKSPGDDQSKENKAVTRAKTSRDKFFELEEYQADIYNYLREHELANRPKAGYMKKQPDITHNMRSILVDWLVEVAEEYKLHSETLYLAVNFIDRFLSYMSVVRGKLQLVGTAAMFIAAKFEEIFPPDVSEFVYITDDTYTKRQVIRMEHLILKVLSFDLSIPTPLTFVSAICIIGQLPEKTMYLAMYFCELSMLEAEPYLELLPSALAAGAIALARHTFDEEPWTSELHRSTGYELKHLQKAIEFLNSMFVKAPTLPQQAIQEKYNKMKYLHVSKSTPSDVEIKFDE